MGDSKRRVFLGIDLGTSEAKVALVTIDGEVIAFGRADYPLDVSGGPGWAEQDAERWWRAVVVVTRQLVTTTLSQIVAICCSGQGPSLVCVDGQARPIGTAITWMDGRATAERIELGGAIPIQAGVAGILPFALWTERRAPNPSIRWYLNSWEFITLRMTGRAVTGLSVGQTPVAQADLARSGVDPARFPPTADAGSVVGGLL